MAADEVYRYLIDNQDFVVFWLDPTGLFKYISPAITKFAGYTESELTGKPFTQFIDPADLPEVQTRFRDALAGTPGWTEFRARRKDGSVLWLRASSRPHTEHDRPLGVIGILTDSTERKQAEEALLEATELNRQIIAGAGEGIAVLDRELRYRTWNPFMEQLTGYSSGQMLGRHAWEVFPGLVKYGVPELLKRSLDGEFNKAPDMLLPGASEMHWVAGEHGPLRDGRGNIVGVILTVRDITRRKEAERALRDSEDRYRDLAENSQDLLCMHDLRGKLLWLNTAPARSLGYSAEEMIGTPLGQYIAPDYRDQLDEYLVRIQRDGVAKGFLALLTRSGERRIWEYHNTLRTEGVPAPVVRGMARDVTERMRAERRLRRSEERFRVALKGSHIKVFNQDLNLRFMWAYNLPPGLSESDFLGKTDDEVFSPDDAATLTAIKRRVLETGKGARESVSVTVLGARHYYDLTVEPMFDSHQTIVGITCAFMDVTELREKTEQLSALSEKLAGEKLYLESEIEAEHHFGEIIGESAALKRALGEARVVAATDSTVLILGETGTGKELIARAVHRLSTRSKNSFIKLNCAAIPTGLLESELFGHERGAFTGAVSQKIGRLELADKGTLFLDEVGDIPRELQPKLLRVLQDREFERLGSTRTLKVNVRLVAATNRDLSKSVAEKQFRSDLFYRLNVFPIHLPALRDRRDDIPQLVKHFAKKYGERMNKQIETIPTEIMDALVQWDWPGNVRELENFVERCVILTDGPLLKAPLAEFKRQPREPLALDALEREQIVRVLRECRGVIAGPNGAAERLGMKRTTLQSKMQRFGISRAEYERGSSGGSVA